MQSTTSFASAFVCARALSRPLLAALFAALSSGCVSRTHIGWDTRDWLREVPQGLAVIETREHRPTCTGAVIGNSGTSAYVLTARHCVVSRVPGHPVVKALSVAIPELRSGAWAWLHYPATRVLVRQDPSYKLHDKGPGGPPGDWALSDWAILEAPAPGPLPVMRLASPEMVAKLRPLDRATLLSFFDDAFENLYPHGHEVPWGEYSSDFVQGGHSGGPVLSSGGIIATFRGARVRFHILSFFYLPGPLTFTSVETIRSEAGQCGFAIDDPGAPPGAATSGDCWVAMPAHD